MLYIIDIYITQNPTHTNMIVSLVNKSYYFCVYRYKN